MSKPTKLQGRARIVPIPDVDTDMIFHNKFLHIINPQEMGHHIFGNLKGWESFPESVQPGDILFTGHNFGCGSSRQQAVDGLISLGVAAIVGESFGAIYKRNAINAGWPLIECQGVLKLELKDGEQVQIDLITGIISGSGNREIARGRPMTDVQREIYEAGGLLELV